MDWIDVVKDVAEHVGGFEGFCVGNTIKYLWAWKCKRGLDDLQEAQWYLDMLLDFKRHD